MWLGVPAVGLIGAALVWYALDGQSSPHYRDRALTVYGLWVAVLGSLVVAVRCSGTITGERDRQTWDGLMTSPLTAHDIVRGKLRGVLRSTWPYVPAAWAGMVGLCAVQSVREPSMAVGVVLMAVIVALLVIWHGMGLAGWAAVICVELVALVSGLDVAVIAAAGLAVSWLAMYFLGSVGLWCSARSKSSWRSLLGTVVVGYAGVVVLTCVSTPVACIGAVVIGLILSAFEDAIRGGYAPSVLRTWEAAWPAVWASGAGLAYWLVARSALVAAEATVARNDRIPPDWARMIEMDLPRYAPRRVSDQPRPPRTRP
jgi:hypothetical protein